MPLFRSLSFLVLLCISINLFAQHIQVVLPKSFGAIQKPHVDSSRQLINGKFGREIGLKEHNQALLNRSSYRIESGPLDTCATHTYRLKIGNDNTNDEVTEINTMTDGEMLITGKTNKNNSQDDALLTKLDESGAIVWSKTYGNTLGDEIFYNARQTADGGIIAIGTSFKTNHSNGFIFICKLDGNGNVQWTRKYQPASGSDANGADIIQLTDNSFAFLGDDGKNILYGNLSSSGSLLWDQQCKLTDSTRALNIVEDYNGLIIASAGMDSGWHVSNVIKVDASNGNFIWRKRFGGSNMDAHYIFQKMQYVNLRPRITGIWAGKGKPYQFTRLTVNTSGNIETQEEYNSSITPDTTSSFVLTPWAEGMAFSPNNHSSDLSIFFGFPDVYDPVAWSNSYSASSVVNVKAIERSSDAGFIAACNMTSPSGNSIYLVKVDSAGLSLGCDGKVNAVNNNVIYNPPFPSVDVTPLSTLLINDNSPVVGVNVKLDTAYSCRQLSCPVRAIEDTCIPTFNKTYRSYSGSDVSSGMTITNNDQLILSGDSRDNGYDASAERGFIIKTDKNGNLLSEFKLLVGNSCEILSQIKLADGNVLFGGWYRDANTNSNGFFLSKFDNNLSNIWTKTYSTGSWPQWTFDDIEETSDGSLFVALIRHDFGPFNDQILLMKFNNTGNLAFQKYYRPNGGISLFNGSGSLVSSDNNISLAENIYYDTDGHWKTLITKFDGASGNVLWSKRYSKAGALTDLRSGIKMQNNTFCFQGVTEESSNNTSIFLKLDDEGNTLKQVSYTSPLLTVNATSAANNDILASGNFYNYQTTPLAGFSAFLRFDSNLNIKLSKKTPLINTGGAAGIKEDQQGYVFVYGAYGSNNPYSAYLSLRKYTPDGLAGTCPSDSFVIAQQPLTFDVADVPMISPVSTVIIPVNVQVQKENFSLQQSGFYCGSVGGCDTIWIKGPNQICDTSIAYNFFANKNPGCTAPVNWTTSSSGLEIRQKNDSFIQIHFLKSGSYTISAQLLTGCHIFEDSIVVSVKASPVLNLGPDTSLCPGNTLQLHALPGFQTYQWQDGSKDSTYKITVPGLYYVTTTNACAKTYSDTLKVVAHPPIPFDIGPGISICEHDTASITAPAGFLNYQWSSYNINADTGQIVNVFPAMNYMYKVTAEKTPGCFATDSLLVTVRHVSPVHLGNDTSFCMNQSIVLDAGKGYDTYAWNTGATTETIIANNQNSFSVKATLNGCSVYDTLSVLHIYPLPAFSLGNDTTLCDGQQLQFNFTLPGATYYWNTGSTLDNAIIKTGGVYWLQVQQMGCISADTVVVTFNPAPVVNLGNDTTICEKQTLQLSAFNNNANYLWQDGSHSSDYVVSNTGIYFVTVTLNSCISSDTIMVNYKTLPHFTLGKDTFLCAGMQYILKPVINTNADLLWQDGSSGPSFTVANPGLYFLAATNVCGSYADSVTVAIGPCDIMMPTAFTPNGDGMNDIFRVKHSFPVKQFYMIIYDRWGEKVFETDNINNGWNGMFKGQPASQDSYVWMIRFVDINNLKQQLKGIITLIR
ncbi:MAG: gliding motility-associated C-terminal domain-containing protein [Ginsengibacter sp.]